MRIIGGSFKGKRIQPPKSFRGRPTTDFAKEGLFNTLQNLVDIDEIKVLDLFSGTGSISYEFVSRGCQDITVVDQSPVHCNFIRKSLDELDAKRAYCIRKDVFQFLMNSTEKFDLIFADPPFDLQRLADLPDLVLNNDLLEDDGIFILEHSSDNDFSSHPKLFNQKKYGHVNFSFFEV